MNKSDTARFIEMLDHVSGNCSGDGYLNDMLSEFIADLADDEDLLNMSLKKAVRITVADLQNLVDSAQSAIHDLNRLTENTKETTHE